MPRRIAFPSSTGGFGSCPEAPLNAEGLHRPAHGCRYMAILAVQDRRLKRQNSGRFRSIVPLLIGSGPDISSGAPVIPHNDPHANGGACVGTQGLRWWCRWPYAVSRPLLASSVRPLHRK